MRGASQPPMWTLPLVLSKSAQSAMGNVLGCQVQLVNICTLVVRVRRDFCLDFSCSQDQHRKHNLDLHTGWGWVESAG